MTSQAQINGISHILRGSYAIALHHLTHAVAQHPCDPATWFAIAELYHRWIGSSDNLIPEEVAMALHKADGAAYVLSGLTQYKDDRLAIRYQRGLIQEFLGGIHTDNTITETHYQTALGYYRNALRTIPNHTEDSRTYVTYITLGRILRKLGDNDAAQQHFHHAQVIDSRAPWAYLEMARTLADNRVKAKQMLAQAETVAPNLMAVELTRAELCAEWADQVCAIHAYEAAKALKPGSGWLHSKIGDFYRTAYDPPWWRKSAEHYARVADHLRPNDPWAHARWGEALFYRGEFVEAAAAFEMAMELAYSDGSVTYDGWVCSAKLAYEQAGMVERAEMLVCAVD